MLCHWLLVVFQCGCGEVALCICGYRCGLLKAIDSLNRVYDT
jgi:hypothetical protein